MASELKLANSFWGLSTQDRSLTWSTTSSSEEEEEEELSLCLSLGGIYSRPAQDKPSLLRSSSSSLAGLRRRGASPELSLSRSCSLPTDPDAADTRRRRRSPPSPAKIGRIKNQDCLNFQGDSRQPMEPRGGTGWPADSELSGRKKASWAEVTRRMPSVTTTGDGPHGRRIEGFLYKYTKGHVSIVCVCHGSFLTPAEFVRHAGGTEVENPMRRINVLTL